MAALGGDGPPVIRTANASPPRPDTGYGRGAVVAWLLYDFADAAFVGVVPATIYSKCYAREVLGNERGQGRRLVDPLRHRR